MIYPYNNQKPDILIDGTPDMRLANILAIMDRETFGQRKAASMVGGLGRLLKLIEEGKIRSDKPTNQAKWKVVLQCSRCLEICNNQIS